MRDGRITHAGVDEEIEQGLGNASGLPLARGHHRCHRIVEVGQSRAESTGPSRGQPRRRLHRHLRTRDHDIQGLDRRAREAVGIGGQIGAEERRAHGLECHAHHGLVDFDDGPSRDVTPPREEILRRAHGMPDDPFENLVVEGRLHHAPLAPPHLPGGREQALPRHERQGAVLNRLLVVVARA